MTDDSTAPDRPHRRLSPKLYERALLLYREFPGRHAKVAAALSTDTKVCSPVQAKRLFERGLPKFGLPPIAEVLRQEVRKVGGGPGYDLSTGAPAEAAAANPEQDSGAARAASLCLNAISSAERRKLRQQATEAEARERTARSEIEVRRLEAEARRLEAQAEAARQQAEAEKAKAERIKAEAAAGARAAANGLASMAELSLVERRAQEAQLVGGMRDQVKAASVLLKGLLFTLANKGNDVLTALRGQDMSPDEFIRMTRRVVSTVKDAAEVAEKTVKLERLIFGEPTERVELQAVGGEDPIAAIMSGLDAVRRAAERGVIEISPEDCERLGVAPGS